MVKWQTIVQVKKSEAGNFPTPTEVILDNDFRSGDIVIGATNIDGSLSLRRAVRMSRLRRELNKYLRRIERSSHIIVVLRSNRPVAVIGPPDKMHRPH